MTKKSIYPVITILALALHLPTVAFANPAIDSPASAVPIQKANSSTTKDNNKSCLVSNEQAVAKTREFLNKIGLTFQDSPRVKDISLSNIDYPGIRHLKDVTYGYSDGRMKVRFYVGCESGEVENYDDVENWEDNFPFSAKKEPRECKKTIELLAHQISIPSDMHFEKVERDWRKGIWVGEFVRIRGGYRYELDNVAIGISDKTRKIALYRKIYFGQSCPTEIKINKDAAIKMASTEFQKFIFGSVRSNSDKLYALNEQLLIVQPERSERALGVGQIVNPPLKEKSSRLAWIIRYDFTGGIRIQNIRNVAEMSPQDRQIFEAQLMERENLLRKYKNPIHSFEMRIDAGSGEILYVSHKDPLYYYNQWLHPGHMK